MRLLNATMRPGTILEVVNNQGDIKVEAPGLFPREEPEKLPIVSELRLFGSNSFSSPEKGDEVWVMNFSDNDQQLYWFRKDPIDNLSKLLTDKEGKIDVVVHHDTGKKWGTLYFSDGSGWIMKNGTSIIQIDPKGTIMLKHPNPKRCVTVGAQGISLGSPIKSKHTACFADELIPILNKMTLQFELLQKAMQSNPYTAPAAESINVDLWKSKIDNIESVNVTLE